VTTTRAARAERGSTLVEVLVAVALLGIAFTAILGGLGTAVQTSGQHREEADANAALVSAAETVKAANFAPCSNALATYRDFVRVNTPLPDGWSSSDLDVVDVGCTTAALQMVTVSAHGPDSPTVRSLTVAKGQRPDTVPDNDNDPAPDPTPTPGQCVLKVVLPVRVGSNVVVLVVAAPRQPTCTFPLKVQISGAPASSAKVLTPLGWVQLATVPAGTQCDNHDCSIVVLDGAGRAITTVRVLR
jgi:prepilin-type N-terminal cleavage/methylation domain-containing protein